MLFIVLTNTDGAKVLIPVKDIATVRGAVYRWEANGSRLYLKTSEVPVLVTESPDEVRSLIQADLSETVEIFGDVYSAKVAEIAASFMGQLFSPAQTEEEGTSEV